MNIERLKTDIKSDEGWRDKPYLDTRGVMTFGYGFTWLTQEEGEYILENRIAMVHERLRKALKYWDDLPAQVQRALINMAYQLGVDGLLKFKKTLALIQAGNYPAAAKEALNSDWAQQTPNRAQRVTEWIRWAA